MGNNLTIVARVEAKEDKIEFVKSELIKLIEPTRKEAGCIKYELNQDNENPAVFIFYEKWENRELWQDHMNTDHLVAYKEATEGSVDNIILNEMTLV